jgi:hypothetical protein
MAQVVEPLLSNSEALSSNAITATKKKEKGGKRELKSGREGFARLSPGQRLAGATEPLLRGLQSLRWGPG